MHGVLIMEGLEVVDGLSLLEVVRLCRGSRDVDYDDNLNLLKHLPVQKKAR